MIDFYFNPAFPGDLVTILKSIQYVGQPGQIFNGTLKIAEYPTPEPGSLALMSVASVAVLYRRRKPV
jgi:hypothetical protein